MYGGTAGAPRGEANGAYTTGLHTVEAVAQRRWFRALVRAARETVESVV